MQELSVKITARVGRKYLLMYYDCPASGKRITHSTKATVRREAEKAAGKWEAELREGRYKPKSAVTWQDFRAAFLESMEAAPERTYSSYATAINALERHCKIDRLAELTSQRLKFAAQWDKVDKLTPETVASYLRHLRAMLNWGKRAELLNDAPAVSMPKRQKGAKLMKGRPITGEEFDRMLAKIE